MAPRTKSGAAAKPPAPPPRVRAADEDIDELNEALDDADAGHGVTMTAEEAERAHATGKWPASSG